MQPISRRSVLAGSLLAFTQRHALAQEGPLRIVLGSAAGTTLDALGRIVAEKIAPTLRRPVIVENRPGAGGAVAAVAVKTAGPQGGMLYMVAMGTMTGLPHSRPNVPFDPIRDLTPVAQLAEFDNVFCINAGVPARSLAEYAALVKQDGKYSNYASSGGVGAPPYYLAEQFARAEGLKLTNIAYRATGPLLLALVAGEVSAALVPANDAAPFVRAGQVRLLATTSDHRLRAWPQVPTFRELGYPIASTQWYGLFAPAGTDPARVDTWSRAVLQALETPEVQQHLAQLGMEAAPAGPAVLQGRLAADFEKWGRIIQGIGIPAHH